MPPPRPLPRRVPPVDSQQETGQDRRTKEKGGGGRGVCWSVDHVVLAARERQMQDARDSRKNKKTPPHPPKKRGENTGKTRQGDPTHPEERNATRARGEGKHGKGHPTNPEERRKAPLGEKNQKKRTKIDKISWRMPRLVKGVQEGAGPKRGELELAVSLWGQCPQSVEKKTQDIHNNKKEHSCRSCRPTLVVENRNHGDDTPLTQRGTRPNQIKKTNKARSLKGSKTQTHFPKATKPGQTPIRDLSFKHPNRSTKPNSFEVNKAGWRGPWAAPPSSEELSQETLS